MNAPTNLCAAAAVLAGTLALVGCGSEPPPPEPTPVPTPEPTPEPTPPPPLDPVRLHHVVLDEVVAPPNLPLWSPLDRDLPDVPTPITAAFLREEGGSEELQSWMLDLARGVGPGGTAVALIEWRLRWGEQGEAGRSRHWGACALPCTVEDRFVTQRGHHPVDPLVQPEALFAGRPGAAKLSLTEVGGGVSVSIEGSELLAAGQPGAPVRGESSEPLPLLAVDGVSLETVEVASSRTLVGLGSTLATVAVTGAGDPPPAQIQVLPDVPAIPAATRRRAVEGVTEVWPWPDATRFEGGVSIKPDPLAHGLKFVRMEQKVLWTPTLLQADGRLAEFPSFTLKRPGKIATVDPFPLGADVLASYSLLDDRLRIAFASDPDALGRARQIAEKIELWRRDIALPDGGFAPVAYMTEAPTTILPGSAGEGDWSWSVSDGWSEERSVRRVFARMTLGANGASRGAAALDWIEHVEAKLEERASSAVLAPGFASAGEDVAAVWLEWLRDAQRGGEADPEAFLAFVGRQLPEFVREIRGHLARRSFVVAPPIELPEVEALAAAAPAGPEDAAASTPEPTPVPWPKVTLTGELGFEPAMRWIPLPPDAAGGQVGVVVKGPENASIGWVVVASDSSWERRLAESRSSREALARAEPRFGPTVEPLALDVPAEAEGLLVLHWGGGPYAVTLEAARYTPSPADGK